MRILRSYSLQKFLCLLVEGNSKIKMVSVYFAGRAPFGGEPRAEPLRQGEKFYDY